MFHLGLALQIKQFMGLFPSETMQNANILAKGHGDCSGVFDSHAFSSICIKQLEIKVVVVMKVLIMSHNVASNLVNTIQVPELS
jgi:hypothetical protein